MNVRSDIRGAGKRAARAAAASDAGGRRRSEREPSTKRAGARADIDSKEPTAGSVKRGRGRPLVDDKRRRILDAALLVFAERGFHGTAVPEVAEAAEVGTGTLYRYFESKEVLVNEVFRDAKARLAAALLPARAPTGYPTANEARAWFEDLWKRLGAFAKAEPAAFRFLEMQDHVPYLDAHSRKLELEVLTPLYVAGKRLRDRAPGPPVDVTIALLWGAFVGLVKASRLGYLELTDKKLADAGATCWRLISGD